MKVVLIRDRTNITNDEFLWRSFSSFPGWEGGDYSNLESEDLLLVNQSAQLHFPTIDFSIDIAFLSPNPPGRRSILSGSPPFPVCKPSFHLPRPSRSYKIYSLPTDPIPFLLFGWLLMKPPPFLLFHSFPIPLMKLFDPTPTSGEANIMTYRIREGGQTNNGRWRRKDSYDKKRWGGEPDGGSLSRGGMEG